MHMPEEGKTVEESTPPQGGSGGSGEIVVREDNAPSLGEQIGYPRRESSEYMPLLTMAIEKAETAVEMVEVIERMVGLVERAEERDKERAMNYAIAAFKAECPPIPKDGHVKYATKQGRKIEFRHSKLDTICRTIEAPLTKNGLSYTWDSEPGQGLGRVTTCRLRHVDGAERSAAFHAPPSGVDGSADVQKVGAALTYGQRYSLIQVLGLTATLDDVDGMGPDSPQDQGDPVSHQQLATLLEWVDTTGADQNKLLKFVGVESLAVLPAARYDEVLDEIKRVGERRNAD